MRRLRLDVKAVNRPPSPLACAGRPIPRNNSHIAYGEPELSSTVSAPHLGRRNRTGTEKSVIDQTLRRHAPGSRLKPKAQVSVTHPRTAARSCHFCLGRQFLSQKYQITRPFPPVQVIDLPAHLVDTVTRRSGDTVKAKTLQTPDTANPSRLANGVLPRQSSPQDCLPY